MSGRVSDRPKKRVQGPGGCSLPPFAALPPPGRPAGSYSSATTYFAAMVRAVSESGPGCGTNTASR